MGTLKILVVTAMGVLTVRTVGRYLGLTWPSSDAQVWYTLVCVAVGAAIALTVANVIKEG